MSNVKPLSKYVAPSWLFKSEAPIGEHFQVVRDKRERQEARTEARQRAAVSNDPALHEALQMARNGYGIDDIMHRTKIPRDVAMKLVLGKE